MSYNGSGTFQINTTGQPVVTGTVISSSAFNALTADLATGLSTAITKDGQTATTARIPFAQGISSTLVTDSTSVSTGSIITAGGAGIAKALYVGTTANVAGAVTLQSTLGVTGVATFSAAPIYSSLTASSAVATDASKGLVSVTNTGTGNNVLATSPTLVTPALGTPSSGTVTNLTGTASININGTVGATTANTGAFTTLSATGVTTVQAGTAALPAITTTGDTNTGIFFPAADTIAFSEGGAEAMRIDSSGNLLVGVTSANANGGVLQLKSGITFPATQVAATDANTLDDYEEGNWTPTDGSGAALSFTSAVAKYTKIGKAVFVEFRVTYPSTVSASNAVIASLPFTNNNNDRDNVPVTILSGGTAVSGIFNQGGTDFGISTIGTFTAVTNATLSTITLRGSGWYVVS